MAKKRNVPLATRYDGTQWIQFGLKEWLEDIQDRVEFPEYCRNWILSLAALEEERFQEYKATCKLNEAEARLAFSGHSKRSAELFLAKWLLEQLPDKMNDNLLIAFELGRTLERLSMRWMEEHAAVRTNNRQHGNKGGVASKFSSEKVKSALQRIQKQKPDIGLTQQKRAVMRELKIGSMTTLNKLLE